MRERSIRPILSFSPGQKSPLQEPWAFSPASELTGSLPRIRCGQLILATQGRGIRDVLILLGIQSPEKRTPKRLRGWRQLA